MTSTATLDEKKPTSLCFRIFRCLLKVLRTFIQFVICAWATLAIYFSNLPWPGLRLAFALAFAAIGIWAMWISHKPKSRWVFAGLFLGVAVWHAMISPSHDRIWQKEVAALPRAIIDGDTVHITGFRNFDYRSREDFTVRYEEREVDISHLTSVDFYISYWSVGPVGHTFVSFNFDNAPPVCISIETRPEEGEGYAPLASIFKQYELVYVVGDERDLVRVRTDYRDEGVFLYRIKTTPEAARRLFKVYLERINQIADNSEWYHLFRQNCTLNILRYANTAGREGSFDLRHLINGWADRYFYDAGWTDTSLPFEELRQISHINEASKAAGDVPDYSDRIRESLPGYESKPSTAGTDPISE
jgi:hypothetical protein